MSDLERLLKSTLQEAGGEFRPSDEAAARRRFLEQRRKRRFRFAAAGAVVTATAVLIAVVAVPRLPDDTERPELASAIAPEVMATIPAGDGPTGIGSGNEGIWVADPDAGVVSQIDPATNEVVATIELPGTSPDEVVAGDGVVWASDGGGSLAMIDPATSSRQLTVPLPGVGDSSLDLALGEEQSVWAVDPATGRVYRVSGDLPEESSIEGLSSTDVAAGDEGVWVLDGPAGSWADITPLGTPRKMTPVIDAPGVIEGGPNADLAVGFGYLWISTGGSGSVYRVDPSTEEVEVINVGGRYADLTVGEGAVWALVAGEESAELVAIDPGSATVSGEPLSLGVGAIDVVTGHGSLWVPDKGTASVLRIDPAPEQQASPEVTEDPDTSDEDELSSGIDPSEVLFVFSEDGDLFAQTRDQVERLTDTIELETNPAVSHDGRYVVFERRAGEGAESELVTMDVTKVWECCFRLGEEPALGPHGEQAWVVSDEGGPTQIRFGGVGSKREVKVGLTGELGASESIRNLTFQQGGRMLHFQAEEEPTTLYEAGLDATSTDNIVGMGAPQAVPPRDAARGASYLGVSSAYELNVIHACCSTQDHPPYSQLAFGELTAVAEQDWPYSELFSLDGVGLDLKDSEFFFTQYLGRVAAEERDGTIVWSEASRDAWLIGDRSQMWLIDERGEYVLLPYGADGGAAAPNPIFRQNAELEAAEASS
jgi:streptogramin lyase